MMSLGCDGVFVGSGIFKSDEPAKRARAVVHACSYWKDASIVAKVSENLVKLRKHPRKDRSDIPARFAFYE